MMNMSCDEFILMGIDECGDEFRWNDKTYYFPTELITDEEGYNTLTFLTWEEEVRDSAKEQYPEAQGCFLVNLSEQRRAARAMARTFW